MWISEQLKRLTEVYNVMLGANNTEVDLVKRYRISTTCIEEFRIDSNLKDCAGIEANECDLLGVLRSEMAYCQEFYTRNTMGGFRSTSVVRVVMDESVEVPASKLSCPKCFYDRFVYELLSRTKHAVLPAKLRIGGHDTSISLIGLGCSESRDTGYVRAYFCLKGTVDSKERMFLVAYMAKDSRLCYLELIPKHLYSLNSGYSRYLIDNKTIHSVPKHEPKVYLLPTDLIDFSTSKDTVENLYSSHKQQFDMIFRSYFGQLTNGITHRQKIFRKVPRSPSIPANPSSSILGSLLSVSVLKVAVFTVCACVMALLLRESQRRRTSQKKRVPIL